MIAKTGPAASVDPAAAAARKAAAEAIDRASRHWARGDLDAALACCVEVLRHDPQHVDALVNTGTLLWFKGDPEAAEPLYERALALAPRHVGLLVNLATLRNEAGDVDASLAWIRRAEAVDPNSREVQWRKGLLELANGDYANGWRHYEAGLGQASLRGSGPGFVTAPWDGKPCDRLLLWHEQGLGDTIQFVRYARLCKSRARRVVVLCPPELTALLAHCDGVDAAVDSIGADDFDAQIAMMSLPCRFGTTLATVPTDVPYLRANPVRASAWTERIAGDALKVGLVWAGNTRRDQPRFQLIDRQRSLPSAAMTPLLDVEGVAFYSVQKRAAGVDRIDDTRVIDWMDDVHDFADTAALVSQLDLVIAVDTSVAHLAGAMGKPVWVLSRLDACWRWLRNRADSPWYPTARVFGQRERGRWDDVVSTVRDELVAASAAHAARLR